MLRINETLQPHGKYGKDISYPALIICCQEQERGADPAGTGMCPSSNYFQARVDPVTEHVTICFGPDGRLGNRQTVEIPYSEFFDKMKNTFLSGEHDVVEELEAVV